MVDKAKGRKPRVSRSFGLIVRVPNDSLAGTTFADSIESAITSVPTPDGMVLDKTAGATSRTYTLRPAHAARSVGITDDMLAAAGITREAYNALQALRKAKKA